MVLSHNTRDYLGLSGTIVRLMLSSQKKRWKNPAQKINFFYIYKERVCVYVCIYVYISMYIYLYIYPDPEPRYPEARRPDPEGSGPMINNVSNHIYRTLIEALHRYSE